MNPVKSFKNLTVFERRLLGISIVLIIISYLASGTQSGLSLIASLTGALCLIFLAKGDVFGELLAIIFSILYALVSYQYRYWGEMITYLGMSLPIAVVSLITWLKNQYAECEVKVRQAKKRDFVILSAATVVVTFIFFYILRYFDTPNLFWSTVSIYTSFMAASLAVIRSKFYAVWYSLNDIVLIILWVLASMENIKFLPMIMCFIVFLANDIYGFVQWSKMQKRQEE